MLVVDARVHHSHTDTASCVALPAELVNTGHNVRVVIISVGRRTATLEAVGEITADGRAVGNTRRLSLRVVHLTDGGDVLHPRQRRDLLDDGSLILVIQQGEGATVEKIE